MLTLTLTLTRKAAIDADPAVPLILVQELDKGRGGASLEELQAECPDDLRGDVFFGQESTCPLRAMRVHAHAPAHYTCTCTRAARAHTVHWMGRARCPPAWIQPQPHAQAGRRRGAVAAA